MSNLSGIRDVDREILSKLDNKELLNFCQIDKYSWNSVCDDAFLRRRLLAKYPEIEQYKKAEESWKRFFLRAVRYIALMKEKYGYDYTFGDFAEQYHLFSKYSLYRDFEKIIFFDSAKYGELALVIWSLKNGVNVNIRDDLALQNASYSGHLDIVKYLVEHGANINAENDSSFRLASMRGNLEVVKYLAEKGADIHAEGDAALVSASSEGHLDVVEFLVEHGSDINAQNGEALKWAIFNGNFEIVKYLVENGANLNLRDYLKWAKGNFDIEKYLESKM